MSEFAEIGIEYLEIKNRLAKLELDILNKHKQFSQNKNPLPEKAKNAVDVLRDAQDLITKYTLALDGAWKEHQKDRRDIFSKNIQIAKLKKEVEVYKKFI